MRHTLFLLFLVLFFIIPIQAMLKSVNVLDGDWATIMFTQDGVIIDSDPDSLGALPDVSQSYFPGKNEKRTPTDKVPCVTNLIQIYDLTKLIRDNYPEGFDAQLAKHVSTLRVVNKIVSKQHK